MMKLTSYDKLMLRNPARHSRSDGPSSAGCLSPSTGGLCCPQSSGPPPTPFPRLEGPLSPPHRLWPLCHPPAYLPEEACPHRGLVLTPPIIPQSPCTHAHLALPFSFVCVCVCVCVSVCPPPPLLNSFPFFPIKES